MIHIKNGQNFKPPTKNKSSQTIRIRKKKGKADFVELAELYFPFKINQMVLRCPHLKGGGFTADTLLSHCPEINFFKYISISREIYVFSEFISLMSNKKILG